MGAVSMAFANAKGGVAKTSLALTMADEFSRKGRRVLLVDFDPQATITQFLGVPDGEHPDYRESSIMRLYDEDVLGGSFSLSDAPYSKPYSVKENFDVVFSSKKLQGVAESSVPAREYILRDYVDRVRDEYDLIIIDPPGVLGFFLSSILLASDVLFIPQRVNFHDNTGTRSFLESILREAKFRRMRVNVGGFIPVFFEKTREEVILSEMAQLQKFYMQYMNFGIIRHVGKEIWLPKIRRLVAWEAAVSEDMFLRDYVEKKDRSRSRVLDDVVALRDAIDFVLERFSAEEKAAVRN